VCAYEIDRPIRPPWGQATVGNNTVSTFNLTSTDRAILDAVAQFLRLGGKDRAAGAIDTVLEGCQDRSSHAPLDDWQSAFAD
jgi:hypothetical protein